jgi:hypothetical protein
MKIVEKTHDAITGKETITERDETAAETKERLDNEQAMAVAKAKAEAAEAAKDAAQAKLAALGFTADDLKALGL